MFKQTDKTQPDRCPTCKSPHYSARGIIPPPADRHLHAGIDYCTDPWHNQPQPAEGEKCKHGVLKDAIWQCQDCYEEIFPRGTREGPAEGPMYPNLTKEDWKEIIEEAEEGDDE